MDYDSPLAETLAVLRKISSDYQPAVLANAFGPESMVMTDLIAKHELDIEIFSIDTGRLPEETHALAHSVHRRYGPVIKMVTPDADEVVAWTAQHGQNGFYDAVENRHGCCGVRKVAPLRRVLDGKRAWLAGLRRQQSVTRRDLAHVLVGRRIRPAEVQPDARVDDRASVGLHPRPRSPLQQAVRPWIHQHRVRPCTRAISPGEDTEPVAGGGSRTPSRSAA